MLNFLRSKLLASLLSCAVITASTCGYAYLNRSDDKNTTPSSSVTVTTTTAASAQPTDASNTTTTATASRSNNGSAAVTTPAATEKQTTVSTKCNAKATTKSTARATTKTTAKAATTTTKASSASADSFAEFRAQVIALVNQERTSRGLSALTENTKLTNVATLKSQDMINNSYFSHISPTYGSPFDMMKQFGITYRAAGENIAYGQRTPTEVMNGWMNSSGHRANILNTSFTQIGVGIAKAANGQIYWTQMFIG